METQKTDIIFENIEDSLNMSKILEYMIRIRIKKLFKSLIK